ncbi:signal peptide peptidase SppA [Marinomonas algarum]|uniref:Signal peptide peptidase SppA n=1 Tax=Marinomonas algarum TaxID=2883105 RepID=A0A9X1INZ5_9GAMM|nr:signal peptide peptidase SppA [Marinomonas algarum]MCB5162620.1 signal peptide peptidase SppA [Marinomonas algarum]
MFRKKKIDKIPSIDDNAPWEQNLLKEYMFELHKEQVKDRRWRMLLKIIRSSGLFLILLIVLTTGNDGIKSAFSNDGGVEASPHIAYINIQGQIADGTPTSADSLVPALEKAFENESSKAIFLKINSPGGSPVQSGRIYEEVMYLKHKHPNKKVYAIIGDIGASGGYYIAAAADQIYADQSSLVGSIGVISSSFGFSDLMEKIGVERRTIIAGENKALLDPYTPLDDDAKQFWEGVLNSTHQQFITRVKEGRGERLSDDPQIFTGLIWNGEQALEKGLIDGLGSMNTLAREQIMLDKFVDYTPSRDFLHRLTQRAKVAASTLINGTTVSFH